MPPRAACSRAAVSASSRRSGQSVRRSGIQPDRDARGATSCACYARTGDRSGCTRTGTPCLRTGVIEMCVQKTARVSGTAVVRGGVPVPRTQWGSADGTVSWWCGDRASSPRDTSDARRRRHARRAGSSCRLVSGAASRVRSGVYCRRSPARQGDGSLRRSAPSREGRRRARWQRSAVATTTRLRRVRTG